jgi:2-methylisocitrate lyase-like PEP mutase family enzyme
MTSQVDKAQLFRRMHVPHKPLILYNIWDAGSAKAVERAGARALATSSWSVSAAQGYADGEELPLDAALSAIERIVQSVDLPVSVDFEGGYAIAPMAVGQNARRLLALGVVGLNFEDQLVNAPGLFSVSDQTARLRAIRSVADAVGVPVFINARTDVFLKAAPEVNHASLFDEALSRAAAYAEAGADGFFAPGLTDTSLISRFCAMAPLPINVMTANSQNIDKLAAAGVARISFGPSPYIDLTAALVREAQVCFTQ